MPIYVGDKRVQDIRVGSTGVSAVYVGADKVWSKTAIFFTFSENTTADNNMTSLGFVHYGPDTTYKAISDGNVCRINMPSGISNLGEYIDRVRYNTAVSATDDGYLQFKFGSLGNPPSPSVVAYRTDIFARGSNGGVTHGVGVRAESGEISIISRIANVDVVRAVCGAFDPAVDTFRLKFVGNVWTLYRNGEFAGEWNDSGALASKGASFRSLILRLTGGREFIGARQFGPHIDYVEYG